MCIYVPCVNGKRRRVLYASPAREDPLSLTVDIPRDVLVSVMRVLARTSFVSYVNAKASCKLLRDVGSDGVVFHDLHCGVIPLFVEDEPRVQKLLEDAAVAGNLRAIFRIGFFAIFQV